MQHSQFALYVRVLEAVKAHISTDGTNDALGKFRNICEAIDYLRSQKVISSSDQRATIAVVRKRLIPYNSVEERISEWQHISRNDIEANLPSVQSYRMQWVDALIAEFKVSISAGYGAEREQRKTLPLIPHEFKDYLTYLRIFKAVVTLIKQHKSDADFEQFNEIPDCIEYLRDTGQITDADCETVYQGRLFPHNTFDDMFNHLSGIPNGLAKTQASHSKSKRLSLR